MYLCEAANALDSISQPVVLDVQGKNLRPEANNANHVLSIYILLFSLLAMQELN